MKADGEDRTLPGYRASMTVEAALALPLFMVAMVMVGYLINVVRIHTEVGTALKNTCREMTAYAYVARNLTEDSETSEGTDVSDDTEEDSAGFCLKAFSIAYAQASVSAALDSDFSKQMIPGGVFLLESSVLKDGQTIDLIARYQIKWPFKIFGVKEPVYAQRARMSAWVGYDPDPENEDKGEQLVYVTETGTVYHLNRDCVYLNPSIRQISGDSVGAARSGDGSIYYPCETCHAPETLLPGMTVYITTSGNRYHISDHCSALKRSVRQIPISEVGERRPCSKCGK